MPRAPRPASAPGARPAPARLRPRLEALAAAAWIAAAAAPAPAAAVTLPGLTMEEGRWQRLLESNAMEDFESLLTEKHPQTNEAPLSHVIKAANASLAGVGKGDLEVRQRLEEFTINDLCHHVIEAKQPNATGSVGFKPGTFENEVNASVFLLVNTSLRTYAIFKKGFNFPRMRDCWYYAEKPIRFDATFHDQVEMKLNLQLSEPRAEEVDGSGKQVVFSLRASLARDETNLYSQSAGMQELKTEATGPYGCGVQIFWGFDFVSWWFPVCTRIENYLRNNTVTLTNRGVPNISSRVLEQLEIGTKNVVGSSVVIPVQIAGAEASPLI